MRVGIAGAGAIAMGYAALLLDRGHSPMIWSPSGKGTEALVAGGTLTVSGAIGGEYRPDIAQNAEILAENEVIVIALPANGYRLVIDHLVPVLRPEHTVIFSGHLSLGALYLAKRLAKRNVEISIGVWNTTVLTSKSSDPKTIKVGTIRKTVQVASLPVNRAVQIEAVCANLFGNRFTLRDDILTILLSNTNPESHLAITLCNLSRMELGESWGQRSTMTNSVGRLVEALDLERLAIAKAMGKEVHSVLDHYKLSFGVTCDSVAEAASELALAGKDPAGPKRIDTRYVTEDLPYGIVPLIELAKMNGVNVALHQSGLAILNACYGRNFESENDLLAPLEIPDKSTLMKRIEVGYLLA